MQSKAEVFIDLQRALMKLAQRMLGSEAEAEDMVQEAFLKWQTVDRVLCAPPKPF